VVKLNLERVRELILSCKGSLNIYDLEFLRSFCEYFVRDNALSSFLNNILFGDLNRYGSSSIYDRKKGVIVIDEKAIESDIELLYKSYYISRCDERYKFSIFIFKIIHECTHVYQLPLMRSKKCQLLRDIFAHSLQIMDGYINLRGKKNSISSSMFYNANHDLFPTERHANLVAYDFLLSIIQSLYPDDIELISDILCLFDDSLCLGYHFDDEEISPLEEFYRLISREDLFSGFSFQEYSDREKLMYGMPMDYLVYNKERMKILQMEE